MTETIATWAEFDHLEVAGLDSPEPLLRSLRSQCPIGRSDQHGGFWVVTDHELAGEAARQPELFRSAPHPGPGPGFPYSDKYPMLIPMIGSDPPLHRDFRAPLQKTFGPHNAESMAPVLRTIVTRLIDSFITEGEADLATQLTIPLPAWLTGDLLDIPLEGRQDFRDWAQEIVATGGDTPSFGSLVAYIRELYALRREAPGQDIPSMLLTVEIDGHPITEDEWVGTVLLLILAGLDTTANGAALMLHFLAENTGIRDDLIADPSGLMPAIEEMLRLLSPVPQHSRGVAHDVEFGGVKMRENDVVMLHWWAANRDEKIFPDPDAYVANRSPNRHYAFGAGPHRCLGANLARVELRVMFEEVLRRLPDFALVPGGTTRYAGLNRGMSHLRVTFTPGPREGAAAVAAPGLTDVTAGG